VNKTPVKELTISEQKPHDFLLDDKSLLKQALTCFRALGEYTVLLVKQQCPEPERPLLSWRLYRLRAEKLGLNKRTIVNVRYEIYLSVFFIEFFCQKRPKQLCKTAVWFHCGINLLIFSRCGCTATPTQPEHDFFSMTKLYMCVCVLHTLYICNTVWMNWNCVLPFVYNVRFVLNTLRYFFCNLQSTLFTSPTNASNRWNKLVFSQLWHRFACMVSPV
jgi:hypothetical protein